MVVVPGSRRDAWLGRPMVLRPVSRSVLPGHRAACVTGPAANAAYDAAVVYAHKSSGSGGQPNPLSSYWSPLSGYMAGAASAYVPLTIRGSGVNTNSYFSIPPIIS